MFHVTIPSQPTGFTGERHVPRNLAPAVADFRGGAATWSQHEAVDPRGLEHRLIYMVDIR